jgi:antitoxin MazE
MEVTRNATGLTVNIPDDVAKALNLKVGDAVNVVPVTTDHAAETSTPDDLDYFFALRKRLPEGWKFNRDEANERR